MRVLHLTTCYPRFEGDFAGVFVQRLVRALGQVGIDGVVLAPGDNAGARPREIAPEGEIHRFSYAPHKFQTLAYGYGGIPSHLREHPSLGLLIPSFLGAFAAEAVSLSRKATLVHANWLFTGLVAIPAAWRRRIPLVVTLRGSDMLVAERSQAMTEIARWVFRKADFVIAVSDELRKKAIALGIDEKRIEMIANGVELPNLPRREDARRELDLPPTSHIILYIGNIIPSKGIDPLLEAMPTVLFTLPDTLLVLVGGGEWIARFEGAARSLKLADRVRFIGFRPTYEIPSWLVAADLFVLPSYSEGRPNSLLEAMAAGLPVVATHVGGVAEVVLDGRSGILVPAGDPNSLASAIIRLLTNPQFAHYLAEGANQVIRNQGLTWEVCAARTMAVYKKALSTKMAAARL